MYVAITEKIAIGDAICKDIDEVFIAALFLKK
jgi:hypothetical protein